MKKVSALLVLILSLTSTVTFACAEHEGMSAENVSDQLHKNHKPKKKEAVKKTAKTDPSQEVSQN